VGCQVHKVKMTVSIESSQLCVVVGGAHRFTDRITVTCATGSLGAQAFTSNSRVPVTAGVTEWMMAIRSSAGLTY